MRWISRSKKLLGAFADLVAVAVASAAAPVFAAPLGAFSIVAAGRFSGAEWTAVANQWWLAETLGAMTVIPVLIVIARAVDDRRTHLNRGFMTKVILYLVAVAVGCYFVFFQAGFSYLLFSVFVLILLAAAGLGSTPARLTALVVAIFSISATTSGVGAFAGATPNENLHNLDLFLAATGLTGLAVGGFRATGNLIAPSCVLLTGWFLSGWLYGSLDADRVKQDEARFDKLVTEVETRIGGNFRAYEDALRGAAGHLTASGRIGARDWHIYVSRLGLLKSYPGTAVISIVQPVPDSELANFTLKERRGDWPNFTIRNTFRSPNPLSEHFLVVCTEPPNIALRAVGGDLSGDPLRRVAAERARDSGTAVLTRTTILVQDGGKGLQLFEPVYRDDSLLTTVLDRRRALTAWVTVVFRADAFFETILGDVGGMIDLHAFDGDRVATGSLLFGSTKAEALRFERLTKMDLGGNTWTFGWNRLPGFPATSKTPSAWLAGCTALLSLVLAGLVMALQTGKRRATDRLNLIQSALPLGTWEIDINRQKVQCSGQLLPLYGISKPSDRLDLEEWLRLVHSDDREGEIVKGSIRYEESGPIDRQYHVQWPDGSEHWLHSKALMVFGDHQRPARIIGVDFDITERVRLEERLRQGHKMEAIGRLAGGVAHDFNNLLMVINGYSDLLLKRVTAEDGIHTHLTEIRMAGERARELTSQMLAFGRHQVRATEILSLGTVIEETEKMLRRLIAPNIEFVRVIDAGLGKVRADRADLTQILMNLALNARDAMPNGGFITFEARNVEVDEKYARTHPQAHTGSHLLLSVTDTGTGMDADVQEHLFEPFFTTKPVGKGTGLGLATVYGIVAQCGGWIEVESRRHEGTAFRIYLPRVDPAKQPESAYSEPPLQPFRGTETILLVEDHPQVGDVICSILQGLGYQVVRSANGDEAVRLAETYEGTLDLLLTDVVMPGIDGLELARRMEAVRSMPVLFMSGFPGTAQGVPASGVYIQKPFAPQALAKKVREALDTC